MVTYCVTKIVTTCSPMVGQFFDHQVIRSAHDDQSKYKCWKLFRATLSSEDAQRRRLKNFFQIRPVSSQWTSLIHLSHGQTFTGDEEFVILVTLEPGFSFPYEANPEFEFDENAESER